MLNINHKCCLLIPLRRINSQPLVSSRRTTFLHKAKPLLLLASCLLSSHVQATLMNGDFSNGFSGWQGEVADVALTAQNVTPSNYPNNYSLLPSGAELRTSTTAAPPNDLWSVALWQIFTLDTLSLSGSSLELSLNLFPTLSDSSVDFAFAQLEDLSTNLQPLNLISGGMFDVSSWSGLTVKLSLGVQDGDNNQDTLRLSNIAVNQKTAPVPEPASLLLMGSGLWAFFHRKRLSHT